ncbi:putative reverse transcriptase domain-containing protein [Tanacetum coccineum]
MGKTHEENYATHEENYATHDLELEDIVFALRLWRHYMYRAKCVVFTDHKSLQYILNQNELNMRQRRWIKLLSNYDYEICYHLGKVNIIADALSRKERIKPLRVRALVMIVHNNLPKQILDAQNEAMKQKNCLTCAKVKAEHRKPSGLLQQPEIPVCKWERITMDFVSVLPGTQSGYDTIWVTIDRLTKSAHFLPTKKIDTMQKLKQLYLKEIMTSLDMSTTYHPQTDGQSERTIQTLEDMLCAYVIDFGSSWDRHLPLVEFSYNNSYHASIKATPFEALYGRKCRSPGVSCQKSYADRRTGPFEFKVGDMVLLKNLKKCLSKGDIVVLMDEVQLGDKLHMIEEPVEIVDREEKRVKKSRIPIVKVHWNMKKGP